MTLRDWWLLDPLPVPPAASRDSMQFYRWWTRVLLQARREA